MQCLLFYMLSYFIQYYLIAGTIERVVKVDYNIFKNSKHELCVDTEIMCWNTVNWLPRPGIEPIPCLDRAWVQFLASLVNSRRPPLYNSILLYYYTFIPWRRCVSLYQHSRYTETKTVNPLSAGNTLLCSRIDNSAN